MDVTRVYEFSASHRLHDASLTEEENLRLFGKCTNPKGHGHNYVIEVTLRGGVDPKTGVIVNLTQVRDAIRELIVEDTDHRHLNHTSEICRGVNPTAENLVVIFWQVLHKRFGKLLHEIRLRETDKNWVTYRGE